jgi:outer membrane receptor protein involved in Fe transport
VGDAGTTEASRPSRRRGFEWNAHYHPGGGWLIDLHVARSRARFTDAAPEGDRIPGSVETVASLGITYDGAGPWSGSFHLRHFGPRDLVEDGSVRSSATTLAYARLAYRFNETWRASLDVFNLFDRKANDIEYYYESRLPGEPAEGVSDRHFHPAEPRSFRVTVTLRF